MSKSFKQLSFWNPLDHLRLLWWIFVMPQRLKVYRESFGNTGNEQMIIWIINTLIWLPLLLPSLTLGFKQAFIINAWQLEIYLIIVIVIGLWLLTGWLANIYKDWIVIVALAMLFAMVVGFSASFEIYAGDRSITILMLFSGIVGLAFCVVSPMMSINIWKTGVIASIATSFYSGMVAVIVTGLIASIFTTTHNTLAILSVTLVAIIAITIVFKLIDVLIYPLTKMSLANLKIYEMILMVFWITIIIIILFIEIYFIAEYIRTSTNINEFLIFPLSFAIIGLLSISYFYFMIFFSSPLIEKSVKNNLKNKKNSLSGFVGFILLLACYIILIWVSSFAEWVPFLSEPYSSYRGVM